MSEKIKFKKYNDLEDLSPSELKKAEKHFKNLTNPHSIFFGGQDRIAFDNARKAQLEEVRAKLSSLGSQGAPGSLKKQKKIGRKGSSIEKRKPEPETIDAPFELVNYGLGEQYLQVFAAGSQHWISDSIKNKEITEAELAALIKDAYKKKYRISYTENGWGKYEHDNGPGLGAVIGKTLAQIWAGEERPVSSQPTGNAQYTREEARDRLNEKIKRDEEDKYYAEMRKNQARLNNQKTKLAEVTQENNTKAIEDRKPNIPERDFKISPWDKKK